MFLLPDGRGRARSVCLLPPGVLWDLELLVLVAIDALPELGGSSREAIFDVDAQTGADVSDAAILEDPVLARACGGALPDDEWSAVLRV